MRLKSQRIDSGGLSMRLGTFVFLVVLLAAIPFTSAFAATFAGGTGERDNPYQIATAGQLTALSDDISLFDRSFILTADIDLAPRLPGNRVFPGAVVQWSGRVVLRSGVVVEGYPLAFEGSFDGNGHSIRNCTIFGDSNAGLFLLIGVKGIVRNLHMQDVFQSGIVDAAPTSSSSASPTDASPVYRGALAVTNAGTIEDCSSTGSIIAYQRDSYCGGLVGHNNGTLNRCSAECRVTAGNGGGLIGQNSGTLSHCSAGGQIMAYSAGGLIALNEASAQVVSCTSNAFVYCTGGGGGLVSVNAGTIRFCRSESHVCGGCVGGLVGGNTGTVRECHAAAVLESLSTDQKSTGGLIGSNFSVEHGFSDPSLGAMIDCYSTSTLTIRTVINGSLVRAFGDGLVADNGMGLIHDSGTVLTSYSTMPCLTKDGSLSSGSPNDRTAWETVRYVYYPDARKPQGQVYDPNTYGYGVPLLPEEMMHQASFLGWDFDTVWAIREGQEYPHLRWEDTVEDK
jgi:hypothetical protein